jgi:hypothetical protein
MEGNIWETGKMVNKREKEFMSIKMPYRKKGYGQME